MRRSLLLLAAGGLAMAGMFALAALWYSRPTVLRVAVTRGGDDAQLIAAAAQSLVRQHESVRLRIVPVNDTTATAAALEADEADLAVVRSDVRLPLNGQTLVLLHRNPAILVTTRATGVTRLADLRGKTVAVVRGPSTAAGNIRLLESILTQYELSTKDVRLEDIGRDEVATALRSGRAAAVMAVGALTSQNLQDVVSAATAAGGGEPVFLPITEARAMAQRAPAFESVEIVRGAFGGYPPKPADPFETLGVSVRLMASNDLPDRTAAELTRLLFAHRPAIAQAAPLANQIEAPSTARGAAIPVHPGAAAFLDDDEKTFFDRYSDFIYIGAMVLSILGSAAAAFASRIGAGGRGDMDRVLARLLDVLARARLAGTAADLDALEAEIDGILALALSSGRVRRLDGQQVGAMTLAIDQARRAIEDARRRTGPGNVRTLGLDGPRAVTLR